MRPICVRMVGALLVFLAGASHLQAAPKAAIPLPPFTPANEAAALQFVEKQHPELGEVLGRLRALNRDQYEQAIRQIYQDSARLAMIMTGDEKLHGLMLDAWKVNSRIEVLAAQLATSKEKDPTQQEALKQLLFRHVDLQRQVVEHNREKLLESLKGMEANIKLLEEKREEMVDRRFRNLIGPRKAASTPQDKPSAKPAPVKP